MTDQTDDIVRQLCHDLRNPLTSVRMSLEMLRDQTTVAADQDAMWVVERALNGARRMEELIDQVVAADQDGADPGSATP